MNKGNLAIVSLFCVYISAFFILNTVTSDKENSFIENRTLQQKPEFSFEKLISGEFSKEYETYVTDQFIFRDDFIEIKSTTEQLLGKKENNNVYISTEKTLIDKFLDPDYTRTDINLRYVGNFAQSVEIPVHFTLVPTQNDVYSYKLPKNAPFISQKELIDYAYDKLSEYDNINKVNVYDTLMDKNDEYIYFNTDHHWTALGAYYAYVEIIEQMNKTPIEIENMQKETITDDFFGTIYSNSGVRNITPDIIDIYTKNQSIEILDVSGLREDDMYNMSKLENKDQYEVFLGGNDPLVTIKGTGEGKLLVIKDSYANCQVPFYLENFEEIHIIDMRFYRIPMSVYIEENDIDNVLIMYSMPNFTSDTNITFLK